VYDCLEEIQQKDKRIDALTKERKELEETMSDLRADVKVSKLKLNGLMEIKKIYEERKRNTLNFKTRSLAERKYQTYKNVGSKSSLPYEEQQTLIEILRENDDFILSLQSQIHMFQVQVRDSELVATSAVTDVSNLSHYRAVYTATLVPRTHELTLQLRNEIRDLKERIEKMETTDQCVRLLNLGKLTQVQTYSNHNKELLDRIKIMEPQIFVLQK
jgi:hypothetical protein